MKLILIIIACTFSFASSYKILGVFPFSSKSHYAIGEATMLTLHEAGHEVTMISVHELKKPMKNYRQIKIVDLVNTMEKSELKGKADKNQFFSIFSNLPQPIKITSMRSSLPKKIRCFHSIISSRWEQSKLSTL